MQCVILAGGLGTRMRPLTETCPKTLLPVHGRPFAAHQLDWLAAQGVTEVVYSIGHHGDRSGAIGGRMPRRFSASVTWTKARRCAEPVERSGWRASKAFSTNRSW